MGTTDPMGLPAFLKSMKVSEVTYYEGEGPGDEPYWRLREVGGEGMTATMRQIDVVNMTERAVNEGSPRMNTTLALVAAAACAACQPGKPIQMILAAGPPAPLAGSRTAN